MSVSQFCPRFLGGEGWGAGSQDNGVRLHTETAWLGGMRPKGIAYRSGPISAQQTSQGRCF